MAAQGEKMKSGPGKEREGRERGVDGYGKSRVKRVGKGKGGWTLQHHD